MDECLSSPCSNGGSCADTPGVFVCTCASGFFGVQCEADTDECASSPCVNAITCINVEENAFICQCVAGYTGVHCESDIDECASSPCINGGTCLQTGNSFSCACSGGYVGVQCESDFDECASCPCFNDASCTDNVGGFTCTCRSGHTGASCELEMDECASSPCSNGATCTDNVNGFTCACARGYTGTSCEMDVDECTSSPCQNGGTCTNLVDGFSCICVVGYTDQLCSENIDECSSEPCRQGATCIDHVNGFSCVCMAGFTDTQCSTNIDECDSSPCQNSGTCEDHVNMYTCLCAAGFTDALCSSDIDECASSPCQNGASCTENVGSFTCLCVTGFFGMVCDSIIDECGSSPCANGSTCNNIQNGFQCTCAFGFSDTLCSQDINECASSPCQNGGTCTDAVDGFSCACKTGYTGSVCSIDIDECASSPCATGFTCTDAIANAVCTEVVCSVIVPAGATLQDGSTPVGPLSLPYTHAPLQFVCVSGYSLNGIAGGARLFSIACTLSGAPSASTTAPCQPERCGTVPVQSFATARNDSSVSVEVGDSVLIQCLSGYSLDGTAAGASMYTRQCLGAVYSAAQTCRPVNCGVPSNSLVNSQLVTSPPLALYFGQSISYTCNAGYSTDGTRTGNTSLVATCGANGLFTTEEVLCQSMPCTVTYPTYANVATRLPAQVRTNERLTYTCKSNFTTDGRLHGAASFSYECTASNTLQLAFGETPRCAKACATSILTSQVVAISTGGVLETPNGTLTIRIPVDYARTPQLFTIETYPTSCRDSPSSGATSVSNWFRLRPSPRTWNKPLTVTLKLTAGSFSSADSVANFSMIYGAGGDDWSFVTNQVVNLVAGTVTGQLSHFSTVAAFSGLTNPLGSSAPSGSGLSSSSSSDGGGMIVIAAAAAAVVVLVAIVVGVVVLRRRRQRGRPRRLDKDSDLRTRSTLSLRHEFSSMGVDTRLESDANDTLNGMLNTSEIHTLQLEVLSSRTATHDEEEAVQTVDEKGVREKAEPAYYNAETLAEATDQQVDIAALREMYGMGANGGGEEYVNMTERAEEAVYGSVTGPGSAAPSEAHYGNVQGPPSEAVYDDQPIATTTSAYNEIEGQSELDGVFDTLPVRKSGKSAHEDAVYVNSGLYESAAVGGSSAWRDKSVYATIVETHDDYAAYEERVQHEPIENLYGTFRRTRRATRRTNPFRNNTTLELDAEETFAKYESCRSQKTPSGAMECQSDQMVRLRHDYAYDRSTLHIQEQIGKGEFGLVLKATATDERTGLAKYVALKTLHDGASAKEQADYVGEATLLTRFHHDNVMGLLGVCLEREPWLIVLEFCPNGDLRNFLRVCCVCPGLNVNYAEQVNLLMQIASGMEYLAGLNFIHRDLAARNCLVNQSNVVKVADFGLSRQTNDDEYYRIQTKGKLPVRWMALESLEFRKFSTKTDVWSFGVVMWEVMTFGTVRPYKEVIVRELARLLREGKRLPRPRNCPAGCYELMNSCWQVDSRRRPTFEQLKSVLATTLRDNMARGVVPRILTAEVENLTSSMI